MSSRTFAAIQRNLLDWFAVHQRDLPWRRSYLPYEIWISEIMLQQTQVKTVLPYYQRWIERFPDIVAVAEASEEELLKYWEGMGYYSRVRNIHKAARLLVKENGGAFPSEHATVLKLPGIGRYTAGAVMSVAFNQDFPVVDGNVERVFARLFDMDSPVKEKESQKRIWETARALIPSGKARDFNQALMELGALICLPRNPLCIECPVDSSCQSHRKGTVEARPVMGKRKSLQAIEVAVGLLLRQGKIFVQKRPPDGLMPHLWEFPGGKVEEGETPEAALIREFREELELDICGLDKIIRLRHNYTSFKVTLHAYFCTLKDSTQEPVIRRAVDARWVPPEALQDFAFPAANRKLIELL
jgi:A/G-specific adenine glycosylase